MKAVRVHEPGGPEMLQVDDVDAPAAGRHQVVVDVAAAGVNFIDVYHRTGSYPLPPPIALGMEGAGTVRAVGDDVGDVAPGDRVAWWAQMGSYAEEVAVGAEQLVAVPEDVDLTIAAALMLQGLTAHYLATSTFPLEPGHTALVHAAAGGVGHLLVQIAARRGARVIGTVSTAEKAALAESAGADAVIRYTEVDWVEAIRELTDARGVDVVYDSVGHDTFTSDLAVLRPRGYLVLYGQSSGPVEPFDPQLLNRHGSLFLTRPTLGSYVADRAERLARSEDLFAWVRAGALDVRVDRTWPLDQAAEAHRYLEARKTKGKLLLLP